MRDTSVTGLQTCALQICTDELEQVPRAELAGDPGCAHTVWMHFGAERGMNAAEDCPVALVIGREEPSPQEIGRASCRERVEMSGGVGALQQAGRRAAAHA